MWGEGGMSKFLLGGETGTSFQFPALSQKHVRNVFHTVHQYFTKFRFDSYYDTKEISITVTSII